MAPALPDPDLHGPTWLLLRFPEISKDGYCGDMYEKTQDEIITSMLALLWIAANGYDNFVEVLP